MCICFSVSNKKLSIRWFDVTNKYDTINGKKLIFEETKH